MTKVIEANASSLRQGARFALHRSVRGLPALPSSVHPVTAAYYRGCETYLPLQFSGSCQRVYVVCLSQDDQGRLRLWYVVDVWTGRPVLCRSEREAWRVCRRLPGV